MSSRRSSHKREREQRSEREYEREWDRGKRRSRSRSRSRSYSPRRRRDSRYSPRGRDSRSRSRDRYEKSRRSRDRYEDRRRSYSRSRSRSRSRSSSLDRTEDRYKEVVYTTDGSSVRDRRFKKNENHFRGEILDPKCILMRGIKTTTTEETIREHVKIYGAVLEVRLIRDKVTGESRGFAFIDFSTPEEAKSFLEHTKSTISIDGNNALLDYSREKTTVPSKEGPEFKDWVCPSCQGNNFARRKSCYLCQNPKPDNAELCSVNLQEKSAPSSVLVIRGLDSMTTEDTLWSTFSKFGNVKEVRLIKDKNTQVSRGFCFLEFSNVQDATKAFENSKTLKVDGKLIKVSYTRGTAQGSEVSSEAIEQAKWSSTATSHYRGIDPILLINSERFRGSLNFTYDAATGFYFDSKHGLYYEPKANYYWDCNTKLYYSWDDVSKQYSTQFPSDMSVNPVVPLQTSQDSAPKKKEAPVPKATKPVRSKKLDTQLEKWNYRTKELQPEDTEMAVVENEPKTIEGEEPQKLPEQKGILPASTQASFVCLLCERGFKTQEGLQKHEQKSQLHQDKLALAAQKQQQLMKESAKVQEERRLEKKTEREKKFGGKQEQNALDENNVGNQLLQKMGWREGEGIGRNSAVVTAPIEVQIRPERAGLGSYDSSEFAVLPGDNFKVAVKKRAMARWDSINSDQKNQ